MSRVHDMGGRFGDGPVHPEAADAPIFAEPWHGRALGVTLACGALGLWNIDVSRHARERLAPKDYTRFSYYEKWMAALADLLVETGAVTRAELARDGPAQASPLAGKALQAADVAAVLAAGGPADRPGAAPAYALGQAVQTRRPAASAYVDGGHTRLPSYAAGAQGRIVRSHGCHVLPDSAAHRLGEAPEPLYAVAFAAAELWAQPEHPQDEVILDLWESYLEPVDAP